MRLKVAAFTSGLNVPSSRFRVRQLIPVLSEHNVRVKEYASPDNKYGSAFPPGQYYKMAALTKGDPFELWLKHKKLKRWPAFLESKMADITWLERMLVAGKLTYELRLPRPLVFDLDDAIWLPGAEGHDIVHRVVEQATMIFAGNRFLADWCTQYNSNVKVVHTSVDTDRFVPATREDSEVVRIGWIGTSSNYKYLQLISDVVNKLVTTHKNVEVHICADKAPDFELKNMHFTTWSEQAEVEFIQSLDIGLMPLEDSEWARGKCSFKLLQYMACGVPAVASPVGMNAEVLHNWNDDFAATTPDDWKSKLSALIADSALRRRAGDSARAVIEHTYSSRVIGTAVAQHFYSLK